MSAAMSLSELQAAGRRASAIESAILEYQSAKRVLDDVNRFVKANQVWRPELRLDSGKETWGHSNAVTIRVDIPAGVIQQQAVYAVDAARRKIIALGGEVPAEKAKR